MKRFLIFTKAMLLIHLRSREELFWNFAFPVFLMFVYGLLGQQTESVAEGIQWLRCLGQQQLAADVETAFSQRGHDAEELRFYPV